VSYSAVLISQSRSKVGAIEDNVQHIITTANSHKQQCPELELVVFPEQALLGMPAFDLLLRDSLCERINNGLNTLSEQLTVPVLVGYPKIKQGICFNALGLVQPSLGVQQEYYQHQFEGAAADQGVARQVYFAAGQQETIFSLGSLRVGVLLGQDYANEALLTTYQEQEVDWLLHCSNNVFTSGDETQLVNTLKKIAHQTGAGVLHCSAAGGQDTLVMQGGSFAVNGEGEIVAQAPLFHVHTMLAKIAPQGQAMQTAIEEWPVAEAALYGALAQAVKDYVATNGFRGALLGLSGGIDSALTLAVAADALGPENVRAIMMPFDYTSAMSKEDAAQQAATMGVAYEEIPIRTPFDSFMGLLANNFTGTEKDTTEENLQARCRGVILMALSNKLGKVVLACSNKSETAVGYSTLYGDMVGGFCPLRDVPKTWVYRLARWRNEQGEKAVIPQRVIDRPPTAELAPGQLDQNSLPDYPILDEVVHRYVELHEDADTIIAAGLPAEDVRSVIRLIDRNEYKRQQGALGPKVTSRGFGANRRYPVTYSW